VFTDAGVSGGRPFAERPAGSALLTQVYIGTVIHVIVAKLDRLSRSTIDGLSTLEILRDAGVSVSAIDMDIYTSTPMGEMALTIALSFATLERKVIKERTHKGLMGATEQGRWPGGMHPIGWVTDENKRLVLDTEGAATASRIFNLIADGHGPKPVANILNAEGVPTSTRNGKWPHGSVQKVVRRKAYTTGLIPKKLRQDKRDV